jgi:RNA polymerase subunit RPABC4/transcription elongation factor Spt4
MALIKCGECNQGVSSKASVCPHCGYYVRATCERCKYISYDSGVADCPVRGIDVSPSQRACLSFKEEEPWWI